MAAAARRADRRGTAWRWSRPPRERDPALVDAASQQRIATALAQRAPRLVAAGVVIAKGGITSAVTAREGLGARSARVVGPVVPGVSLWQLAAGPGLRGRAGQRRRAGAARRARAPSGLLPGRWRRRVLVSFRRAAGRAPTGSAVGAFTCYDLEVAAAVLQCGRAPRTGRDPADRRALFTRPGGGLLLAALVAAAERSEARACVQLDHCDDLAVIEAALAQGAGAVMADGAGAALRRERRVRAPRRRAGPGRGAGVECELGGITGDEDVAEAVAAGALTDPAQAVEFMAATGADCLAVSIGNIHGIYRGPARARLGAAGRDPRARQRAALPARRVGDRRRSRATTIRRASPR